MSELEHFGVKGMQWGKRNSKTSSSSGANKEKSKNLKTDLKASKSTKQHKMGDIVGTGSDGSEMIYVGGAGTAGRFLSDDEQQEINDLVDEMKALHDEELALINSIEDKGGDSTKDPKVEELKNKKSKSYDRYYELYTKAQKARKDSYTNGRKNDPMPQLRGELMPDPGGNTYTRSKSVVAGPDDVKFKTKDRKNTVTHTDMDNYLEHHGVKGMKWGVRKDRKGGSSGSSSKSKTSKSKSSAKPTGKAASVKKSVSDNPLQKLKNSFDPNVRAKKTIAKNKAKAKEIQAKAKRNQQVLDSKRAVEDAKRLNDAAKGKDANSSSDKKTKPVGPKVENIEKQESQKSQGGNTSSDKDTTVTKTTRKTKTSDMSDQELRNVLNRMDMEKRYAAAMEEARPKRFPERVKNHLKKTAKDAVATQANAAVNKLATAAIGAGVGYALNKATSTVPSGSKDSLSATLLKTAFPDVAAKSAKGKTGNTTDAAPSAPKKTKKKLLSPSPDSAKAPKPSSAPKPPSTNASVRETLASSNEFLKGFSGGNTANKASGGSNARDILVRSENFLADYKKASPQGWTSNIQPTMKWQDIPSTARGPKNMQDVLRKHGNTRF